MNDINILVRDNIRSLIPYSSARDEYSGDPAIFLDANENPYGTLNRYPDPLQKKLKKEISLLKDIPVGNIFLGNGSDEAIDLLYRIFCTPGLDKALIFTPTYGMYEVCARVNDIGLVTFPLDENFDLGNNVPDLLSTISNLKLVIICTPNNPTGNSFNPEIIENILRKFNGIVAIDEAYTDFSCKPSNTGLLGKYPNLVVLQTFSKAWGLAAARVGMAFAGSEIISLFNKVKYPYNISAINQEAALNALKDKEKVRKIVRDIISQREQMADKLRRIELIREVYPSDANFLLVKIPEATEVYNSLVRKGIIVRNRSSIIRDCLRITIGTEEENNKLINELQNISTK